MKLPATGGRRPGGRVPFGRTLIAAALLSGAQAGAAPISSPHGSTAADLARADQLAQGGHSAEAMGLYRLVAAGGISPEIRSSAWLHIGQLSPGAPEAEASFRRAQEQASQSLSAAEAGLELGKLYYSQGNYRGADQVLASSQTRLMGTPLATEVNLFRARTAMALHMYAPAGAMWQNLSQARSMTQRSQFGLGQTYMAQNDPRHALEAFDRYAQNFPGGDYLAAALAGAARAAGRAGEKDKAMERQARLGVVAPTAWEAEGLAPPVAAAPVHSAMAKLPSTPVSTLRPQGSATSTAKAPAAAKPVKTPALHAAAPPARQAEPEHMPTRKNDEIQAPASAAPAGAYYLQLGVFSSRDHAEKLAGELKKHGFPVRVREIQAGGARYQVRSDASYESREAAASASGRFKAAGFSTQSKPENGTSGG
jgi:cell division protein FtsN